MMGCLTAPFRVLGCLVLIALLLAGWLFRDQLVREARRLLPGTERPAPVEGVGRPGSRSLATGRSKVDSLNGWRADSVVLSASELASLIRNGLDPEVRSQLDSLQVRLLEGEVAIDARLHTARLPKGALGPFTVALRPVEPVEAAGPIRVIGPGEGEWVVRSFKLRDIPIPQDLAPVLVARALGDSTRQTVPLRIPAGVRRVRIDPRGVVLYGTPHGASRP
jgi:hypothetical protein